jgi:hypothetical protein
MFSPILTPGSPRASWREALRRAVDLAVAFATLESYALPERGPRGPADPTLRAPRSADPARTAHPHRAPLRAPSAPGSGRPAGPALRRAPSLRGAAAPPRARTGALTAWEGRSGTPRRRGRPTTVPPAGAVLGPPLP